MSCIFVDNQQKGNESAESKGNKTENFSIKALVGLLDLVNYI